MYNILNISNIIIFNRLLKINNVCSFLFNCNLCGLIIVCLIVVPL